MARKRLVRIFDVPLGAGLIVGAVITSGVIGVGILGPFIVQVDPNAQSLGERLTAPGERGYVLGSDQFGRDILSRLIIGARISLMVGIGSSVLGALLGTVLGIMAGYGPAWLDGAIGRLFDIILAFPTILLALALVATLGPSTSNLILAIGITTTPNYGRVVRASVLSIKARDFIMASRALGCSTAYAVGRHIVPNILSPLLVTFTVGVATSILVEATLSFLGLGTPPPTATWGSMISDGKDFISVAPWISGFAGVSIVIAVLGLTMLGDALRDLLDPKVRS